MSAFQLYVILKLDDLHKLATSGGVCAFTAMVSLVAVILWFAKTFGGINDAPAPQFDSPFKWAKRAAIGAFLLVSVVPTLTPTTKQAAVIWAVPQILESRAVQKDLPELYNLAVDWAKNQLAPAATAKAEGSK